MSLDADIVDAIVLDLEENADLATHSTIVKYRRPRAILPGMCPALVVWLEQELPILERGTTVRFEYQYTIGVSWHEASVTEALTVKQSDEISRRMLDAKQKIRERVHAMSLGKGLDIPETWSVMPGGSRYFQTPREEGLTEGFAFSVLVRTTQT